jgi:phosphosulfolactate synthase
MEATAGSVRHLWHPQLRDPSGRREAKPRRFGLTMVIDKGLGPHAFEDLLATAGDHVDIVKFAFGTSPLYPDELLRSKIALARRRGVTAMPGGTLLETAVRQDTVPSFFRTALDLGFDAVEVSDGTIEMPRPMRTELISMARGLGLRVFTEFGKKKTGSRLDVEQLMRVAEQDREAGADIVIVEARESGTVGLFDEGGALRESDMERIRQAIGDHRRFLWEAPRKEQQVALLHAFGPQVNLGNIPAQDVLALEAMRRGLRSDTFGLQRCIPEYVI